MTHVDLPLRSGRADFRLPDDVIWLDTAHQGPLPGRAADALMQALAWKMDPSRLPDDEFFATPDRLRAALGALLGLPPSELVIANSASYGLDLLVRGLPLERGDEIVLVRDDFPATVAPWLPLRERGVRIRFLPRRRGIEPSDVATALRPRTRVFCTTWIDSFTGHVLDAGRVGAVCRDAGVLFVLNATQGFGVRPLPVGAGAVDAITCAGYKWLCGPYGTGFCWISAALMGRLRPGRRYWLPSARERGLQSLGYPDQEPPPAGHAAHDVFCTASFFNLLPWIAAVEYLAELGIERISAHNAALVEALREAAAASGLSVPVRAGGAADSPMLLIEGLERDAGSRLVARLRRRGIHVALREGRIRIAPHVHNVVEDVEKFATALRASVPNA